jgi:tRNA-Thr(GGU) m(6)t(6)A37 methyltransferase TsaA
MRRDGSLEKRARARRVASAVLEQKRHTLGFKATRFAGAVAADLPACGDAPHMNQPATPCIFQPIGWVRSPYTRRFGTPQQASAVGSDAGARLELDGARIPEDALADLEGVERIWVLSFLDRGGTWSARVRPPRGSRELRGVFATRSPDRPNPIGLSAVRLLGVAGCTLHVRGIDLLDGTPILDIKPYVPYADAFPAARAGWIDEIPAGAPQIARYFPTR